MYLSRLGTYSVWMSARRWGVVVPVALLKGDVSEGIVGDLLGGAERAGAGGSLGPGIAAGGDEGGIELAGDGLGEFPDAGKTVSALVSN